MSESPGTDVEVHEDPEVVDGELVEEVGDVEPYEPPEDDIIDGEDVDEPEELPEAPHGERPGGGHRPEGPGWGGAGGKGEKKRRTPFGRGSGGGGGGFHFSLFNLNFRANFSPLSGNKMIEVKQRPTKIRPLVRRLP